MREGVVEMSKDIMCPYFREPCLREGCTAFSLQERVMLTYGDGYEYPYTVEQAKESGMDHLIYEVAYCSTLKCDLPKRANNA